MRVLFINAVCGTGSTGRICAELAEEYEKKGWECRIAYGRDPYVPNKYKKYAVRIGSSWDVRAHAFRTRLLDEHGFGSKRATKQFLKWVDQYKPDLLWLHNLHGYYINVEILFEWIKIHPELKVKWTLHDCWAFTGHCAYFTVAKCEQWKVLCRYCVQKKLYPASKWKDNCENNYKRKCAAFTGVPNMILITPSLWLAELVKESFLKEYLIEVHYNSIDTEIFKPTQGDFRNKYGLEGKKIVLGVASTWDERKGLDDFVKLSEMLESNTEYVIVLVGLNEKQIRKIERKRKNILCIRRTTNQKELAEIYTEANIFVNPSREETFGMTTVEALACGTKAVVYKGTACEEIADKYGGIVSPNDIYALYNTIISNDDFEN